MEISLLFTHQVFFSRWGVQRHLFLDFIWGSPWPAMFDFLLCWSVATLRLRNRCKDTNIRINTANSHLFDYRHYGTLHTCILGAVWWCYSPLLNERFCDVGTSTRASEEHSRPLNERFCDVGTSTRASAEHSRPLNERFCDVGTSTRVSAEHSRPLNVYFI